nr:OmpA family protein [uncultured Brevundimonas sp.]
MNTGFKMAALAGVAVLAACAPTPKRTALVVGETGCAPISFDVYFIENQARLTEAATTAIDAAANRISSCSVRSVKVVGLADNAGAAEANLTLSQRRARAAAMALVSRGLPAPAFDVSAAGDAGAVTAEGLDEPLRRRASVVIDAHPR